MCIGCTKWWVILPVCEEGKAKPDERADEDILPVVAVVHGSVSTVRTEGATAVTSQIVGQRRKREKGRPGDGDEESSCQRSERYPCLDSVPTTVEQMKFPSEVPERYYNIDR